MRRYQVYLNPHSVSILDELSKVSAFSRSQIIREAVEGAASRVGNLLALFKAPNSRDYSWLEKMTGSLKVKGRKKVNISERVDQLYYL